MFKLLHQACTKTPQSKRHQLVLTTSCEMEILNILKDMHSTEESLFRLGGTLEIWESHIVILVEILAGSGRVASTRPGREIQCGSA
jgi:hypothetical protein